ncbi:hypothetical protein BDW74DRAFT_171569 [Aspergillus multicolor]|uniref:uncharacterized protein n=1 Tax=Aspergillus multicolor TaxID=41759 RepID=UPI003CCCAFBF
MRISESKVIVNTLSEACGKAEQTGTIDVNDLLSKPEFVRSLRELWAHIPEKTRRSIGRSRKKVSHGSRRVETRQLDMPEISPPQELLADVPYWIDNPLSFFQEEGSVLDLKTSPIIDFYNYLGQLDLRGKVDNIRARFVKVIFHRLKERLGLRYMRSNSVDVMVTIISKSGMDSRDMDNIKSKITRWTDTGKRIDLLCRSIGGSAGHENSHLGNLFCLPEDCHDELLLGLKGLDRDQRIQRIKDRGILTVQDRPRLDDLAAKVFDVLWSKVDASINDMIIQAPHSNPTNLYIKRAESTSYSMLPNRKAINGRSPRNKHANTCQ